MLPQMTLRTVGSSSMGLRSPLGALTHGYPSTPRLTSTLATFRARWPPSRSKLWLASISRQVEHQGELSSQDHLLRLILPVVWSPPRGHTPPSSQVSRRYTSVATSRPHRPHLHRPHWGRPDPEIGANDRCHAREDTRIIAIEMTQPLQDYLNIRANMRLYS